MNTIYIVNSKSKYYPYIVYEPNMKLDYFDNIKYILIEKSSKDVKEFLKNNFDMKSITKENDFIKYELNRKICKVELTDGSNSITYNITDYLLNKIDYFLFYQNETLPEYLKIELSTDEFFNVNYLLSRYIYNNKKISDLLGLPILNKNYIINNEPEFIDIYVNRGLLSINDIIQNMNDLSIIKCIDDLDTLKKIYFIFVKKFSNIDFRNLDLDKPSLMIENKIGSIFQPHLIIDYDTMIAKKNKELKSKEFKVTVNTDLISVSNNINNRHLYNIALNGSVNILVLDDHGTLLASSNNNFYLIKLYDSYCDIMYERRVGIVVNPFIYLLVQNVLYFNPLDDFYYDVKKSAMVAVEYIESKLIITQECITPTG